MVEVYIYFIFATTRKLYRQSTGAAGKTLRTNMMEHHITAERIANILMGKSKDFVQKRMFGGDCFMVDNKMLVGTYKGGIMARVGVEAAELLVKQPATLQMTLAGKPMKGYLFIEPEGYENDSALEFWIEKCLAFNPKAKASAKKK